MSIDEIEQLMKDGKIAEADAAAKELSEREPGNLRAKMLYGTCRQLLGDEETFRRIHDELAPMMEKLSDIAISGTPEVPQETLSLWEKYHALWMSLIVSGLVLTGIGVGAWFFGRSVVDQFRTSTAAVYGPSIHIDSSQIESSIRNFKDTTANVDWMDRAKKVTDSPDAKWSDGRYREPQ